MLELKDLCQVKDVMASVVELEAQLRRQTGLSLNQAFALCCLARGPLGAGALADEVRIHGASLSRIIKSLHQRGLIVQEMHGEDSRQKVLSLSGEGRAVASTLALCEAQLFPLAVVGRGPAQSR